MSKAEEIERIALEIIEGIVINHGFSNNFFFRKNDCVQSQKMNFCATYSIRI